MAITFDDKTNFAYSVVATAPSPATTGTSLIVATGDGAKFPSVPFNAVIWPTGVQPTTGNAEIVRVTNITSDTLTITREQEGTTARTVVANDQISCNVTVKTMTDIEEAFATASALTLPLGGAIMWFTDTAPTGYLLLRGQAVSRATYASLFALWSTTFGVGDGSTTFNVPNLQARIPIGRDTTATYAALDTLGETQGSWDHTHGPGTLTVTSHTHGPGTLTVASHTHDSGTLTVASHTHGPGTLTVASHSHGEGTLAVASHTHDVSGNTGNDGSHDHTGTTDGGGDHTHDQGAGGGSFSTDGSSLTDASGSHTHTFTTDADGTHSHTVDIETSSSSPGLTGDTGAASPAVNAGVTASTAPSVNAGATGATAPAVTSGVSAATAPTVGSGVTAAGNPPVLVVNFIVRATNEV